ncbi:MAG TPA: hypothetical protein VGP72_23365 [Planctomycetota bacterium]
MVRFEVKLQELFALVTQAVDEQIAAATHAGNNGGNGNGPVPATNWRRSPATPPAPTMKSAPSNNGYAKCNGGANGNGGNGRGTTVT